MAGTLTIAGRTWAGDANDKLIERGRYVVTIGSCNDCHTPGYAQSGGQAPESP